MPNGQQRDRIQPGMKVGIVKKEHQRTGEITEGIVDRLLTKSSFHSHGIKVRLTNGAIGRVKVIQEDET